MNTALRVGSAAPLLAALLLGLGACGGKTPSGGGGGGGGGDSGRPTGGDDDGGGGGGMCGAVQLVQPQLTLKTASGQLICNASLVESSISGVKLLLCDDVVGCKGTCFYTVTAPDPQSTANITVQAPGYQPKAIDGLQWSTCGCGSGSCDEDDRTITLTAGGDDAGGPSDGGADPCPTSAPTVGLGCEVLGLWCQYGANANPYCDDLFACQNGFWADMSTHSACPAPTTACPAYTADLGGSGCGTPEQFCSYAQATCICSEGGGGLPVVGDAGISWQCTTSSQACPSPIPELGSACNVDSSTTCDYGACSGGPALSCEGGFWVLNQMVACAG
jgi:hypothetical protein